MRWVTGVVALVLVVALVAGLAIVLHPGASRPLTNTPEPTATAMLSSTETIASGGPDATAVPTASKAASPSLIPTATPAPKPVPSPTATPIPVINATILRITASAQTGTNFNPLYISATATCPAGTHLLSGGYNQLDDADRQVVPNSYPLNDMSWYAITSVSDPNPGGIFNVYANCLQASMPITTTIVSTPVRGPFTVNCPSGTFATGGGWGPADQDVIDYTRPSGTGWFAQEPQQVYAVCTGLAFAQGTVAMATYPVPSYTKQLTADGQVHCPTGQFLVGGGFASSGTRGALKLNKQTISPDGSAWQISVENIDSVHTFNATVYAVCVWAAPAS